MSIIPARGVSAARMDTVIAARGKTTHTAPISKEEKQRRKKLSKEAKLRYWKAQKAKRKAKKAAKRARLEQAAAAQKNTVSVPGKPS